MADGISNTHFGAMQIYKPCSLDILFDLNPHGSEVHLFYFILSSISHDHIPFVDNTTQLSNTNT